MIHSAPHARTAHPAPELKAVLFDLDGTLVDSVGVIFDAIAKAVRKHGFEPDFEAIRTCIGQPITSTLASFVDADKLEEVAADYTKYYNTIAVKQTKLFPGVKEGLAKLAKKYSMGIVTGKYEEGARISLKQSGIDSYFQVVVGADTAERSKPYPDPVFYALERLKVKPAEAIFVGDAVHDIHAAKNAGVRSVAVLTGTGKREEFEGVADEIYETIEAFFESMNGTRI